MNKEEAALLLKDHRVAEYNKRHLEGRMYTGSGYSNYLLLPHQESVVPVLAREWPNASYSQFEKELDKRARILLELERSLPASFDRAISSSPVIAQQRRRKFVCDFFTHSRDLSFKDQIDSFKLTATLAEKWPERRISLNGKEGVKSEYELRYEFAVHPEAPLAISVYKGDKRIGGIGGFMMPGKGGGKIRITNIQGVPREGPELERLNSAVGKNWRVYLVEGIAGYCKKKGIQLQGVMPAAFEIGLVGGATKEARAKIGRMYKQTYRKAGLAEKAPGLWKKQFRRK